MRRSLVLALALTGLAATPAVADTLREALAKAYTTNPTLTGARAGQRANDENVVIQRAQGLPNLGLSGSYQENIARSGSSSGSGNGNGTGSSSFSIPRSASGQLNLGVPLYQGGAIKNSVRAADARIDSGQAQLRDTEASIFTQVVAAYMDVLRDEAIVGLNRNNVRVLTTNLEATRDRFEVGDLTRTDIAQSESRLALARGQLEIAESTLISSKERYVEVVGNPPGVLEQPPPLPNLPTAIDAAVDVALADNPNLIAANRNVDAARYDIGVARASRLPTVSAVANQNYTNYLGSLNNVAPGVSFNNTSTSTGAGLQLTLPLFQGGGPGARVRQAQARSSQAIEQLTGTERNVVSQTRSAYASWRASNANILSFETAVRATALSLEGVRAENSVGTRTILDILNAEQEYLNAQVNLVSARRNAYVAGFSLLAAMGHAEARDLGLEGGVLYDPETNYKRVRNRIWDWDNDPKPAPVATRTVDTPAQNSSIQGDKGRQGQ